MVVVPYPTPAERVYTRSEPIAHGDEEAGYPLFGLCEALTVPQDPLEEIVREDDTHPAWARAVDVDEAPLWVLQWLGYLVGVQWLGTVTEQLRTKIRERPRYKRGTVDAMRSAASETLTGTKTIRIIDRVDDNQWRLLAVTSPGETPDAAATESALLSEKRAGVVLTFLQSDEPIIDEGAHIIDALPDVPIDSLTVDDWT